MIQLQDSTVQNCTFFTKIK